MVEVRPTNTIEAYIIRSDLDSQGGHCLHDYVYKVGSERHFGDFQDRSKDCEYNYKIEDRIIVKYLIDRPWVSRFVKKDFDGKEESIPSYVKKFTEK